LVELVEFMRSPVVVLETVYKPSDDTELLAEVLDELDIPPVLLEIGSGSGAVSVRAASRGALVLAVDSNPLAAISTRFSSILSGVEERVRPMVGDLFSPVLGLRFKAILFNPPYLPVDPAPGDLASTAWAGGRPRGRRVIDRFLSELPRHLAPDGVAILIQTEGNGLGETEERARSVGLSARILREKKVAFDTLLALAIRLP